MAMIHIDQNVFNPRVMRFGQIMDSPIICLLPVLSSTSSWAA